CICPEFSPLLRDRVGAPVHRLHQGGGVIRPTASLRQVQQGGEEDFGVVNRLGSPIELRHAVAVHNTANKYLRLLQRRRPVRLWALVAVNAPDALNHQVHGGQVGDQDVGIDVQG